jgi:hypothetical protein
MEHARFHQKVKADRGAGLAPHEVMSPLKHSPELSALDGPDYVTLVIDWDTLAAELEDGTSTAPSNHMATNNSDWIIDDAGIESFPADPPAWGSSRAVAEHTDEQIVTEPVKKRSYRKPVLLGVLGLFALTGILAGIKWMRDR